MTVSAPGPIRQRPATMQPRFALGIIYIMLFFGIYCFALAAPQMFYVWQHLPTGPEQEQVAAELVKDAIQPKLLLALLLSVATCAFGMMRGWLPGTRPPV